MNETKILQLLGLAQRAGRVQSGEEIVLEAVRSQKCKLVILAEDGSYNTKKKFHDKCNSYQVPLIELADRYKLGSALGKESRVVIGILDQGFATKIVDLFQEFR